MGPVPKLSHTHTHTHTHTHRATTQTVWLPRSSFVFRLVFVCRARSFADLALTELATVEPWKSSNGEKKRFHQSRIGFSFFFLVFFLTEWQRIGSLRCGAVLPFLLFFFCKLPSFFPPRRERERRAMNPRPRKKIKKKLGDDDAATDLFRSATECPPAHTHTHTHTHTPLPFSFWSF